MLERTVITGGAGFVGSHICDYFIEKGHEVICIDSLLTGNLENVENLLQHERFKFVKYDVTNYLYVKGPVHNVLHFASPASPVDYLKFPVETLMVGSIGTYHTLGLAREKKARYMLASTSECYGDPAIHPQPETYWGHVNPVGPRGVYDEAKRFGEAMTMAYHRYYGVDTRIIRIFNTYGPRMRIGDGRALPSFICQALGNEPITVYGDGSQTRSFCYVSDLVEGIYRLLQTNEHYPVNLGNTDEVSILDFAKEIIELTGSKSEIAFKPLPVNDPKVRQPDITKAMELIGWEPKVSRKDGLATCLDYFRKKLEETKE